MKPEDGSLWIEGGYYATVIYTATDIIKSWIGVTDRAVQALALVIALIVSFADFFQHADRSLLAIINAFMRAVTISGLAIAAHGVKAKRVPKSPRRKSATAGTTTINQPVPTSELTGDPTVPTGPINLPKA